MNMMRKNNLLLILTLVLPTIAFLQSASSLQETIVKLCEHKVFEHANLSISVHDIEEHVEIAGYRSGSVLTPASTMKLFTSLSGIHVLGEDFRFNTILGYKGKIEEDGTLVGDLIIKGGGDPTLGSSKIEGNMDLDALMDHWVQVVIDAGITCIQGGIIADESIFDSYPVAPSWQWNDLGNYYASGAWGLNINENQYHVYFKNRGGIGNRPTINSVYPKIPGLKLSNELLVDSSHTGDQAYIFGGPYNYDKRIVGTIPQGSGLFSIKGSIPDPPLFTASLLRQRLADENIQAKKVKTNFYPKKKNFQPIDTVKSQPLSEIVRHLNFESNNLYAEAILKYMGYKLRGQGSGQNGIASIFKILRSYKIKNKHLFLNDGSGLSARNLVSAESLSSFLSHITKDHEVETLTKLIPIGGREGTVRGMFAGSKSKGHVWLKSGSMETIQGYAGYVQSADSKWYSFAIIVNGYSDEYLTVRKRIERIIEAIYKNPS